MGRRKREIVAHFRWQDDRPADEFYTFHGRLFLRGEPYAVEAWYQPESVCENPRRARAYGHATIVLPSRSDRSRTALVTYGCVDAAPELIASMCKSSIAGDWAV